MPKAGHQSVFSTPYYVSEGSRIGVLNTPTDLHFKRNVLGRDSIDVSFKLEDFAEVYRCPRRFL